MTLALPGKRSTTFEPNTDTLQNTIKEKYEFCRQLVTLLILQLLQLQFYNFQA